MSLRTPTAQPRNQYHRNWGNYQVVEDLPNAVNNPLSGALYSALEAGDEAYHTDGALMLCTSPGSPGGGDAVWVVVGTTPPPPADSVRDAHRVVVGLVSEGDVAGVSCDFADNGDGVALALAFASLVPGQDIRLRTGAYNTVVPLPLPANSRLVGEGPENTSITGTGVGFTSVLELGEGASAVGITVDCSTAPYDQIILLAESASLQNVATQSQSGVPQAAHVRAPLANGVRLQNLLCVQTASSTNFVAAVTLGDPSTTDDGGSNILIENLEARGGFHYAIYAGSIRDFTFDNVENNAARWGGIRVVQRYAGTDDSARLPYYINNVRCSLRLDLPVVFNIFDAVSLETNTAYGPGVISNVWMLAVTAFGDSSSWLTGVHIRCNENALRGTKLSNIDVQSIAASGDVRGVEIRTFAISAGGMVQDTTIQNVTVGPGDFTHAVYLENVTSSAGETIERTKISGCAGPILLNDALVVDTILTMNTGGIVDNGTGTVAANNIP